ncbi:MAG: GAF domain-containing protein [Anaerolinea sp.]|nr:GAF domain-containing protein [Anaerolinea sp.]
MIEFLRHPFSLDRYRTDSERSRARLIYVVTVVMLLVGSVLVVVTQSGIVTPAAIPTFGSSTPVPPALLVVIILGSLLTLVLTRVGSQQISAVTFLFTMYLAMGLLGIASGFIYAPLGSGLLIVIMIAGFLLGVRGIIATEILSFITVLMALNQRQFLNDVPDNARFTLVFFSLLFIATGVLLSLFLRIQRTQESERIVLASRGRQELATLTTQLAQRISRHFVLGDLLNTTVEDIRTTYPTIYHVQIFLCDFDANEARLAASTGEVGKALLRRRHSLPIGSRSVIGQVTAVGRPIIASATGETVHKRNEFLPDTAAEAAFPLRLGGTVIGALDLQSRTDTAFDDTEDHAIFQSLADSIAVAVDNARLYEQTEQRIIENQRLIDQMRGAMREVERLNIELTSRAWTSYLGYKGDAVGVTVDVDSNVVRQSAELTGTLDTAIREGRIAQTQSRDSTIVSAPLRVRGQVIGAMEFEIGSLTLAPEDLDLVNNVSERLSLALESARLYEESLRVAQRETTLNQIGNRLQTANTVDALMAETARGLQATLGANRVAIRLGSPPEGAPPVKSNGGQG